MANLGADYQLTMFVILNTMVYNLLNTNFLNSMPYVHSRVTNYASVYINRQEPRRAWVSVTCQSQPPRRRSRTKAG